MYEKTRRKKKVYKEAERGDDVVVGIDWNGANQRPGFLSRFVPRSIRLVV